MLNIDHKLRLAVGACRQRGMTFAFSYRNSITSRTYTVPPSPGPSVFLEEQSETLKVHFGKISFCRSPGQCLALASGSIIESL